VTKPQRASLQPTLLEIPNHWNPETALAVFELIDDLRGQIWSRYGPDIQENSAASSSRDTTATPPRCPAKKSETQGGETEQTNWRLRPAKPSTVRDGRPHPTRS
jgi:hypothetical protein